MTTWHETITDFKWRKQGALRSFRPLTGWGQHWFVWKSQREQLKGKPIEWYHFQPTAFLIGQYLYERKTGNMQSYLAGAQTKSFFSSRPALGSVQEMMSLARSFRRLSHWSSTQKGKYLIVVVVVDVLIAVVVGDPWIRDIFGADPDPDPTPDPTPCFFDIKNAKQKFFSSYFFYNLPTGTSSSDKNFNLMLKFCVKIYFVGIISVRSTRLQEKGRIRIRICTVPQTNGSGSGRPKSCGSGSGSPNTGYCCIVVVVVKVIVANAVGTKLGHPIYKWIRKLFFTREISKYNNVIP